MDVSQPCKFIHVFCAQQPVEQPAHLIFSGILALTLPDINVVMYDYIYRHAKPICCVRPVSKIM